MAPATGSSNNPTPVLFALIFFVMLSCILGVTTYLFHSSFSDAQQREAKATAEKQTESKLARDNDSAIQALKGVLGYTQAQADDPANPNSSTTVTGVARGDQAKYGGTEAGPTIAETLSKLRQALDTANADRETLTANLAATRKELLSLRSEYSKAVDTATAAQRTAEGERRDVIRTRDEAIAAKDEEIGRLKTEYNAVQVELLQEKDAREKDRKRAGDEVARLEKLNDLLNDELQQIKAISFEVADGLVRRVDYSSKLVWINLGRADSLKERMTFSVFPRDVPGIGRSVEDVKGKLEVTRVTEDHLAECRILEEDIYRPISVGDQVYTPLWSPGRVEQFAFCGLIDMDGDGQSDRELLHQTLAVYGAEIVTEVDDAGVRTGGPITEQTKFLVFGNVPDPTQAARPEEGKQYQEMARNRQEMEKEARLHGVQRINLSSFLGYIGYKAKQRLFQPGSEAKFNLRATSAHSSAVEEATARESYGATSRQHNRNRRLPANESSGRTSQLFGRP